MFILITVAILLLTTLTLLILRFTIPGFRYNWWIATTGSLGALISVFAWQTQLPIELHLPAWQPALLFSQTPTFIADDVAWVFSLSIVALCLAIIVTSVVRSNFPSPMNWASTLTFASLGVLAATADNPLTLVLIWAAIDLAELLSQIRVVEDPSLSERVVIAFASRVAGTLLLLWADMTSAANNAPFDFRSAPPQAGIFLILAAALRLGVLPLHLPYPSESTLRRGFGTGLRMVSAASSLVLLTHISNTSVASPYTSFIFPFVAFAAIYGGWMWMRAPDELNGRPYWLIGMGSLAVAASLRGNPLGATAWGCALLLSGSTLFLSSEPVKWLTRVSLVGTLTLSALPFSATATGWNNAGSFWFTLPFLTLAQAMLITGYIRHNQRVATRASYEDQPIWGRNVYPIGILTLLLMGLLLGLFGWEGALQFGNVITGIAASLLSLGLLWLTPRLRILNPVRAHWVRPSNPGWLNWGYQALWALYRQFGRVSTLFTNVLEGESGIMWTLLFLALFISIFSQRTP
ncbi:MAG: hypothetical protein QM730_18910 [Anaerolineales bacterium]